MSKPEQIPGIVGSPDQGVRAGSRASHGTGDAVSAVPASIPDAFEEYDMDCADCWNCAGEGFVSNCFEEYACLYPEDGCEFCTRLCDVCQPTPSSSSQTPHQGEQ